MDASTPPDLDRTTTYARVYRQFSTLTTGASAFAAANAAGGGGAFEGLLVDAMSGREGRVPADTTPLPERSLPPAAKIEAATPGRRDQREHASERAGAPGGDRAEEPRETAAADRSEHRTPQSRRGDAARDRDVATRETDEQPGAAQNADPSGGAEMVVAAVAESSPAGSTPASVAAAGYPFVPAAAGTGGEATELPFATGQGIRPAETEADAAEGPAAAAKTNITPAAGAPATAVDAGVDAGERRATPEMDRSAAGGQPAPASPHRPAAVLPPAPAPVSGEPTQPPAAAGNAGAAADPRLAQATINVTRNAEALQSSPLSALIAASDLVGAGASEMTQQRRKSTPGNTAAAQQAAAATKAGTPGATIPVAAAAALAGQPAAGQPGTQPASPAMFGSTGATAGATQQAGERPSLPGAGFATASPAGEALGDGAAGTSHGRFAEALRADLKAEHPSGPVPRKPGLGDQVSVHITKAIKNGIDRIDIQLKPQSLGRIDVHLEMTGDGRVTATVTAETRQALELLQNDSRALEQALQQAGLKTDSNSLNFNLRGQANSHGEQRSPHGGNGGGSAAEGGHDTGTDGSGGWSPAESGAAGAGRLDIRA